MGALVEKAEQQSIEAVAASRQADHWPTIAEVGDRTVEFAPTESFSDDQDHPAVGEARLELCQLARPRSKCPG